MNNKSGSQVNRRQFLASSALAVLYGASARAGTVAGGTSTPWVNWSGGQSCVPAGRFSPTSVDHLAEFLKNSSGKVRPVGSGHSFTPLVPTDGHILVLDQLVGMLSHDAEGHQATLAAGTTLSEIGPLLTRVGQHMLNLPDIDRQTLAGATATATHGTGLGFT